MINTIAHVLITVFQSSDLGIKLMRFNQRPSRQTRDEKGAESLGTTEATFKSSYTKKKAVYCE